MKIFVYGTLKQGERNHYFLNESQNCKFVKVDKVPGMLYDLDTYPGAKPGGKTTISGEIYDVTDQELIHRLDALEGVPYLFDRHPITTHSGEEVWIYWYRHQVHEKRRLLNGEWSGGNKI